MKCSCIPFRKSSQYAAYSQSSRLYNTARYGAIRFENPSVQTSGIYEDTGIINIFTRGTYLVTYIVNFPANAAVDTTLALNLNNTDIIGTARQIQRTANEPEGTVSAQAIVEIDTISAIRLSSSAIINLSGITGNTVASLTVVQL